jgi:hypothetical protein
MMPYDPLTMKTVVSNPWKKDQTIDDNTRDGWKYLRQEKITRGKVAIVFIKTQAK